MKLAALVIAALIAGCASTEQMAARNIYEAQQLAAQREQYRQRVMAQCRAYGFSDGTDEYRKCLMQVDMANQQQNEAGRQMLLQQYINQQGIFRK